MIPDIEIEHDLSIKSVRLAAVLNSGRGGQEPMKTTQALGVGVCIMGNKI